ncbi:MAG: hypothetical protein ACREQ5_14180 [Candidatus Dormibacteria bacterium]
MRLLIGFGNKARHGKDAAAAAIKDHYDRCRDQFKKHDLTVPVPEVKIFRFAEAIYEVCRKEFGMTTKDAPLLQRVGLERRSICVNYWVEKVEQQLDKFNGIALIADVRFKNEAEMVKRIGGFLVNVQRLNADGTPFITDDRPAEHPSEIELDDFNWDYRLVAKTGESDLAGEQAITLTEYLLGLTN